MGGLSWTRMMDGMAAPPRGGDAPQAILLAFRRFVLLHGCVRSWLWLWFAVDLPGPLLAASALLLSLAFALAWHPRSEWLAPRVALPALALQLVLSFPLTDNHFFLELYAVGLLCLSGRRDRSHALVLASLRWLAVIVLFQTGLQKLLYGQYFSGQFLAFMIGQGERFAVPFELIVSAGEVARLQAYDALKTGQGPFRIDSALFVAASNLVWIAEAGLAGLLVPKRTRVVAACAAIALVVTIQLAARELGFAFLFTSLLLLFTERGNARVLPWFGLLYVYALCAVTGGLPGGTWITPGSL